MTEQPTTLLLRLPYWFNLKNMYVTKCDICKKQIKAGEKVVAGYGYAFGASEFCANCGKPIITFLKKHGLLKEEPARSSKKSKHINRQAIK